MAEIGIVINADTRNGYKEKKSFCGMGGGGGCRSIDFLTDNVMNKREFFRGYSLDVTLYIDMVLNLDNDLMLRIKDMLDLGFINNLCFNRHTRTFMGKGIRQWHDTMYLNALMLSRGKYVAHFDADSAAYRRDDCDIIERMINWVETDYKYVSYPSYFSPLEGPDQCGPDDPDYLWASTRFFFCKRETIDYNEIVRCFDDNYYNAKHEGKPARHPNVMEQILGFLAGPGKVLYPPKDLDQFMIFCWHKYHEGTINKLSRKRSYERIYEFIKKNGGINGPCDVCQEIDL